MGRLKRYEEITLLFRDNCEYHAAKTCMRAKSVSQLARTLLQVAVVVTHTLFSVQSWSRVGPLLIVLWKIIMHLFRYD